MPSSSIKYQKLPTNDDEDRQNSVDTGAKSDPYAVDKENYWSGQDYSSIFSYNRAESFKSFYTYGFATSANADDLEACRVSKSYSTLKRVAETGLIGFCYLLVGVTAPFSLLLSLKFVNQFEKLVVFRLGRVQNPKGPGAVLVLPCIDSWKKVDMRIKAFNVPPVHAITKDAAVVEIGAVVYYCVKDALTCISSVQDFGKIIRTLGHSTLHKVINKKQFGDLERERKILGEEIKNQLNSMTSSWGIEVTSIELSNVKVLKQPEMPAAGVIRTLMQPQVASGIWQTLTTGVMNHLQVPNQNGQQKILNDNMENDAKRSSENNAGEYGVNLEAFVYALNSVCTEELTQKIGHSYQIICTGLGEFYIDLRVGRGCSSMGRLNETETDVTIEVNPSDLIGLLSGQLSPIDAYLSGKIVVTGDTNAAMKLRVLADHMQSSR